MAIYIPTNVTCLRGFASDSIKTVCNHKFMQLTSIKSVPFEPILLSGDNGHKGGFAPSLDKAAGDARSPLFTQQNDQNWAGRPAWCELEHPQKLGTWPDQTCKTILARNPVFVGKLNGFDSSKRVTPRPKLQFVRSECQKSHESYESSNS